MAAFLEAPATRRVGPSPPASRGAATPLLLHASRRLGCSEPSFRAGGSDAAAFREATALLCAVGLAGLAGLSCPRAALGLCRPLPRSSRRIGTRGYAKLGGGRRAAAAAVRAAAGPESADGVVIYSEDLALDGRPASVWYPAASGGEGSPLSGYRYVFSARKLCSSVLGLPGFALGEEPETVTLPVAANLRLGPAVALPSSAEPRCRRGVVLAHGLLCSRFDLAHIAEALARRGFLVVAPEMPDSIGRLAAGCPWGALLAAC
mmetsp:Transcript_32507/g.107146  ORF Transcript_32507/g.107146 Transcript_32507/m.107146 type:complete len:262 (-) Transcript_32507:663-1448(-)